MTNLEFVFDMFMCKHEGKNLLDLTEDEMFELSYWLDKEQEEEQCYTAI